MRAFFAQLVVHLFELGVVVRFGLERRAVIGRHVYLDHFGAFRVCLILYFCFAESLWAISML